MIEKFFGKKQVPEPKLTILPEAIPIDTAELFGTSHTIKQRGIFTFILQQPAGRIIRHNTAIEIPYVTRIELHSSFLGCESEIMPLSDTVIRVVIKKLHHAGYG
jgi:hypothetical protein